MREADLDKLSGMRLQLEVQINTLESANINANTLDVMRRGATALKEIHNGLYVPPSLHLPEILSHTDRRRNFLSSLSRFGLVLISAGFSSDIDKVDATMNSINEQRDIANEIADAISNPANAGFQIDEVRTRGRGGGGRRRWLIGISMVCRRSSRPNSGNWSRRISTSDFWAQITYQYTPRRARAASKHDQQRCKRTKTQSCRHCKLHLRCLDGSFSLADPPLSCFLPLHYLCNLIIIVILSLYFLMLSGPIFCQMSYITPRMSVDCNAVPSLLFQHTHTLFEIAHHEICGWG